MQPSESRVPAAITSTAHINVFNELCFNVRPLASIEGRYKNHLGGQHFSIFCKTAVEDIAHCVTQCLLIRICTINSGLCFVPGRNSISADELVSTLPVVRKWKLCNSGSFSFCLAAREERAKFIAAVL